MRISRHTGTTGACAWFRAVTSHAVEGVICTTWPLFRLMLSPKTVLQARIPAAVSAQPPKGVFDAGVILLRPVSTGQWKGQDERSNLR